MSSNPIDPHACTEGDSSLLMAEYSISHDGRHFHFDGHRYERLADAVAHARLLGTRGSQRSAAPVITQVVEAPNEADRALMLELAIAFEKGSFVFAGFRYDRLIDAANYARHRRQLGLAPG